LAKPDEHEISQRYGEVKGHRAVRLSVPDWMDALGMEELGLSLWEKEMTSQNIPAGVILRANRLMNEVQILAKLLKEENIDTQPVPGYPDALMLVGRPNVFVTKAYKEGRFEVQDASSQLVAPFLQISPGMSVIDVCAGAGGKSLHLAALMQNKGRLIAMDIHDYKLEKLKVRAKRNKVHNLEYRVIESTKIIKRLHGSADRLLIDAPCSGLGVLRRNPDDKWKLSPEKIEKLKLTQQQILQQYAPMLKAGGKMVYATCSILPSENQHQIDSFLQSAVGKTFVKEEEKIILASESGFDGFYMCRLKKER
jgi:16S rRNA (cytosine967-C5)-methyltransferase